MQLNAWEYPVPPIECTEEMREPKPRFRIGPGVLVTAAFIGPGTVITASRAGAEHGYGLLWTVVLAVIGAIVLQSLAAKIGIEQRQGLGESIRAALTGSVWLSPAICLVIFAIGVGNAAYQTGNLTGAVSGLTFLSGGHQVYWLLFTLIVVGLLISLGNYRALHRSLVALVILLSVAFLYTALRTLPDRGQLVSAFVQQRFDPSDLTLILAMIGTTIVPYNLFLHASRAADNWSDTPIEEAIRQSNRDTLVAISLGGLVTAAILMTASSAFFEKRAELGSVIDLAVQLKPTLGAASTSAFALGLFAAGLTSSVTAPIATAYAICGCMGWKPDPSSKSFRSIAMAVLLIGAGSAFLFGRAPSQVIVFAQVANGILLPGVAWFVLVVAVRASPGKHVFPKLIAAMITLVISLLGIWRILTLFI